MEISQNLLVARGFGALHAQDGQNIFVNKDGIASVAVDDRYAGNAVPIVTVEEKYDTGARDHS